MAQTKQTQKKKKTKPAAKAEEIILDAKGKVLGRLASQTAFYLQGKHKPSYMPNIDENIVVKITNASDIVVTGKKLSDKVYWRHSGYPGGIYSRSLEEELSKDPTEVVRRAVRRMLPDNRLRSGRMNRLIITR